MPGVLIDGQPGHCIDASDRGLHYGDGLFETIAVHGGVPALLDDHLRRLAEGGGRLAIPLPEIDGLGRQIRRLASSMTHGAVKLIVTRGSGGRGYRPPQRPCARLVLSAHPFPDYPDAWWRDGVRIRWCGTRLGRNPALAGIKHLNRLEQVLARAEWDDPEIAEGLMRDSDGRVVEGTMTNLYARFGMCLRTPPLEACGVAGVMRARLPALAESHGLRWEVAPLMPSDIERADALLLSNSLIGLWPVARLAARRYDPAAYPRALVDAARALAWGGEVDA